MLIRASRVTAAVLAATLVSLGGCSSAPAPAPDATPHGIDPANMDRSVDPGDDFYKHANGAWMARAEIPPDRSTWGPSEALTEQAAERTRELLEGAAKASPAAGTVQQQSADYYASYMDEAAIEAKGLTPLKPVLDRFAAIDSRAALSRVLGEELRADVDALNNTNFRTDRLFGVWITAALDDPAATRPYLLQGGLDLPDREYYLAGTPRMADVRKELLGHVTRTLTLAGIADAASAAAAVVALETRMARVHAPRHRERIQHAAAIADLLRHVRQTPELVIQELDVEVGVVNHELGALHELDELARDFREPRLCREKLVLDAVHLQCTAIDVSLGIHVTMEAILGRPAINELDATDLDDPVARGGLETRGFRIENDLTH